MDADGEDECPACHSQAFLICDNWSHGSEDVYDYFYECDECGWQSAKRYSEAEYQERYELAKPLRRNVSTI